MSASRTAPISAIPAGSRSSTASDLFEAIAVTLRSRKNHEIAANVAAPGRSSPRVLSGCENRVNKTRRRRRIILWSQAGGEDECHVARGRREPLGADRFLGRLLTLVLARGVKSVQFPSLIGHLLHAHGRRKAAVKKAVPGGQVKSLHAVGDQLPSGCSLT